MDEFTHKVRPGLQAKPSVASSGTGLPLADASGSPHLMTMQLAVCLASAAFFALSGAATPQFALCLLALSQAGYFIFLQMRKASIALPWAAVLLIITSFACFFVSALIFSATSSFLALAFVPALFCLPSIAAVAHEVFVSG
ncbi:MAG: hypothetical protein NTX79_01080 [Candidatus Micrarchaeota archaeon]|nr:hypothetical protein [Candidatus Micrarchaeota archaeon]